MLERACSRLDSISWKLLSAPPTNRYRATNFPIGLIGEPGAGDIIVRSCAEVSTRIPSRKTWMETEQGGGKIKGGGYACIKLRSLSESGGNGYKKTDGRE